MQWALLTVLGAVTGLGMRRIVLWRRCGVLPAARRLYLALSLFLGGGAYLAMAVQETVLLLSGQLTWRNALPLHLCSVMGLFTLPMLLSRRRLLWHLSLYLGLPGALMAILWPAVLETSWPQVTELAFHAMHCAVFLAPLLPLSLGMRPSPWGAGWSLMFLVILAFVALGVNALTGGNYLFLNGAPIPWMGQWSPAAWRGLLAGIAAAVLILEGLLVHFLERNRGWSH